jgi:hypothetical protein
MSTTCQQSKGIVYNVYYFLQRLCEAPNIKETLQDTQAMTVEALGLSESTVRYICKKAWSPQLVKSKIELQLG